MKTNEIEHLIKKYNLIEHPEGGFYSEQFRSGYSVHSPNTGSSRSALTHIYFLLTAGQLSRWHRVLHDEIWNLYAGSPLRLLTFNEGDIVDITLGKETHYFHVVEAGHYQAAESLGEYSLIGCSVAPGFDFEDFSYIEDQELIDHMTSLEQDYSKFL